VRVAAAPPIGRHRGIIGDTVNASAEPPPNAERTAAERTAAGQAVE
jgi:hypothetical protein